MDRVLLWYGLTSQKACVFRRRKGQMNISIVDFWIISVVIIAVYAVAVVASLWILRSCEDGTADEAAEAARDAFRKLFRFAN